MTICFDFFGILAKGIVLKDYLYEAQEHWVPIRQVSWSQWAMTRGYQETHQQWPFIFYEITDW